eukprot:m.146137 g.146137  ORF g.146137 m.146137 type:complete len:354 (-) comp16802_c0_seq1:2093-3154(-)
MADDSEDDAGERTASKRQRYDDEGHEQQNDDNGDVVDSSRNENLDGEVETDAADAADSGAASSAPTLGANMSSFAQRAMAKMGYQAGTGLGRAGQGIVAPVEASNQSGRLGLGYRIEGLEKRQVLDQELEEIEPHQVPPWMPECTLPVPTARDMADWMGEGPYVLKLEGETRYSDEQVVAELLKAKTQLDEVDEKTFTPARDRANPFEAVKKEFFQNRAAMKMANIDAVYGFIFTQPAGLGPNDLLYFADVCAGPGGFTEYIFWRKKWRAKGFGFTLAGKHDFNLTKFNSEYCIVFPISSPVSQRDVPLLLWQRPDHGQGQHLLDAEHAIPPEASLRSDGRPDAALCDGRRRL